MKAKILVVEDDKNDFERLKKSLDKEPNYRVTHIDKGELVLPALEKETPDLVILDIYLPGMDGFEICKRIRQNENLASLPILFLTSSGNLDNKLLGLELGASDFLTKGGDERELLLRIKNLLKLKKVYDDLFRLTVIDSLTYIYNRRYFQQRLADEFERGRRYKRDFCGVIVDIDHFKNINDTYGHPVGDKVIKGVASVLRCNMRSTDIICRFGGDEFGLVLLETGYEGAYILMERLRIIVKEKDLGAPQHSIKVTFSCGISSFLDGGSMVVDEMIAQADVALYQSKRLGRDQTNIWGRKVDLERFKQVVYQQRNANNKH
ncbi:MAG: diguanylate cyclase [Candidatus Omnitrophica bacterium]|nr:diguanylate cyclase [Candidatus Omnitrophota bacterium]MBU1924813.1 diguanylate cyclase [Candidatus Omnitrophota bacterium]